jgi:hypothetical protein
MPVSSYFDNRGVNVTEQSLIEDLIVESIQNHGIDVYYLPRESQSNLDELFGDDPVKSYSKAYKIEMYLESFLDFEGNQEFFSKFGLEVQKSARVAVSKRAFNKYIPAAIRANPKEGDLIFMPVKQKLMEVKFVEQERNFFQAGRVLPYMYGLSIEAFKYNGELLTTGIKDIDSIADTYAFGVQYSVQAGGTGTFTNNEIVYQGASLANSAARAYVTNWDATNLKITLRNIRGEFQGNTAIVGNTSGAIWNTIVGTPGNTMEDANDLYDDNTRIEGEADDILDWSELNPFGSPNEQ